MKQLTKEQALPVLLGLLVVMVLFHLSIITGLIPYNIVWAGKVKTVKEMYTFEAVSIFVNVLLIMLLLLKWSSVKNTLRDRVLNIILWLFILLFAVNVIGNLLAETLFEKMVFTPVAMVFALLLWKIVKREKSLS